MPQLVALPGGTTAYRVTYQSGAVAHALYTFAACHGRVGVDVAIQSPGSVSRLLAGALDAVAPSVAPLC